MSLYLALKILLLLIVTPVNIKVLRSWFSNNIDKIDIKFLFYVISIASYFMIFVAYYYHFSEQAYVMGYEKDFTNSSPVRRATGLEINPIIELCLLVAFFCISITSFRLEKFQLKKYLKYLGISFAVFLMAAIVMILLLKNGREPIINQTFRKIISTYHTWLIIFSLIHLYLVTRFKSYAINKYQLLISTVFPLLLFYSFWIFILISFIEMDNDVRMYYLNKFQYWG